MKDESVCNAGLERKSVLSNEEETQALSSKTRSCTSIYPRTPRKPAAHRLDFSTPRNRYCSQLQYPPTPDPTPSKSAKRSAVQAFEETTSCPASIKRHHTDPQTQSHIQAPLRRRSTVPSFSIVYQTPAPKPLDFSADELKRTCEAVLRQVDWDEVQEYVASNRTAITYRKALKSILQAEVDKIFKAEDDDESSD
ncbi:hypothetical protein MMC26_005473 [Xylographa opegraphella]|nr:hypothetical protein [Xylographa opegraphella]